MKERALAFDDIPVIGIGAGLSISAAPDTKSATAAGGSPATTGSIR